MPANIISVVLAVLVIIVWSFLIRQFVYPRFSRRRAENLQLARLVYSGVLAVALVFVAEMLTLSGPLEDAFILASALCFAVSVPCLATMVLLITAAINGEVEQEWPGPVEWISAIGEVAFYAGIASVFFHYHWGAGVAFLITSGLVSYIGWAQLKPYVASEEERTDEKQNDTTANVLQRLAAALNQRHSECTKANSEDLRNSQSNPSDKECKG